MQRSKLTDSLQFLVDPLYKGLDISDWTVCMEYVLPVSREYHTEFLEKSNELYKGKLQFKVSFDTNLTREPGEVQLQLTFIKVDLDDTGKSIQRVRKTSETSITIVPISAWSDIVPDAALSSIDQRIIMVQSLVESANEMISHIDEEKADNIVYDADNRTIQLTANGSPIGDQITLNCNYSAISEIHIDSDGNLIAIYNDGRQEVVGKTSSDCVGTYVPSMDQDIMTFTLTDNPTEKVISFDIDKTNNWNEIEGNTQSSNYIWQEL